MEQNQTTSNNYNVNDAAVEMHICRVFVEAEPSSLADGRRSFLQAGLLSTALFIRSFC